MGPRFSTFSVRMRNFRHFLAHDLSNPSGYVVICLLGVLGVALFAVNL
jgi:hypothetical protein